MNIEAPISSIMTSSVECVSPDQKIIDIKHIYEKQNFHSHIPVVENDKIIGIVSLVDFMRVIHDATLDDSEEVYHENEVRDVMSLYPSSVSPETSIRQVAEILAKGAFHSMLIATDGKLDGIVTTTDILKEILKD